MSEKQLITLTDRLAVAFVSGVAATLTLLLFPIALSIFVGAASAKGAGLIFLYYTYVFSKTGLFIISSASIAGFLLGPDRIATLFSFFWFTHPFWRRLENNLNESVDSPHSDFKLSRWILLVFYLYWSS
jgi:hypothetical protein